MDLDIVENSQRIGFTNATSKAGSGDDDSSFTNRITVTA